MFAEQAHYLATVTLDGKVRVRMCVCVCVCVNVCKPPP